MIKYKSDEEKTMALFLAERLADAVTIEILQRGYVSNKNEARHLSHFYSQAVDQAIADEKNDVTFPSQGSADYWTECLYNRFGGYMIKSGYTDIWDNETDKSWVSLEEKTHK